MSMNGEKEQQLDLFGGSAVAGVTRRPGVLVFDVETQKSFDEVGGRNNFRELKISVAVTEDLSSGEVQTYYEPDLEKLVDALFQAELVVGFNIKRFDYVVLSAYTHADLTKIPTLDMLEVVEKTLGHRLKLDTLAQATLKSKKSADGLQAIKWFKEGKLKEIADYCCQDVKITGQLYRHGKEKGHLLYTDRSGKLLQCPVKF